MGFGRAFKVGAVAGAVALEVILAACGGGKDQVGSVVTPAQEAEVTPPAAVVVQASRYLTPEADGLQNGLVFHVSPDQSCSIRSEPKTIPLDQIVTDGTSPQPQGEDPFDRVVAIRGLGRYYAGTAHLIGGKYVLTAEHVLSIVEEVDGDSAPQIVKLKDGSAYTAVVLQRNKDADIALLGLEESYTGKHKQFEGVRIADLKMGEEAHVRTLDPILFRSFDALKSQRTLNLVRMPSEKVTELKSLNPVELDEAALKLQEIGYELARLEQRLNRFYNQTGLYFEEYLQELLDKYGAMPWYMGDAVSSSEGNVRDLPTKIEDIYNGKSVAAIVTEAFNGVSAISKREAQPQLMEDKTNRYAFSGKTPSDRAMPGMSGSALVNKRGDLAGVVTARSTNDGNTTKEYALRVEISPDRVDLIQGQHGQVGTEVNLGLPTDAYGVLDKEVYEQRDKLTAERDEIIPRYKAALDAMANARIIKETEPTTFATKPSAIVELLDSYCRTTQKPSITISPKAQAQLDAASARIPDKIRRMNPQESWGLKESGSGIRVKEAYRS